MVQLGRSITSLTSLRLLLHLVLSLYPASDATDTIYLSSTDRAEGLFDVSHTSATSFDFEGINEGATPIDLLLGDSGTDTEWSWVYYSDVLTVFPTYDAVDGAQNPHLAIVNASLQTQYANTVIITPYDKRGRAYRSSTTNPVADEVTRSTFLADGEQNISSVEFTFGSPDDGPILVRNLILNGYINVSWCEWSGWSVCTRTCDTGVQQKERVCECPHPLPEESRNKVKHQCDGPSQLSQWCNRDCCQVDGGWTVWTVWGPCSETCGSGSSVSTRNCSNPAPACGGSDCEGSDTRSVTCADQDCCPVAGGWSAWSAWGPCSRTCEAGQQDSTRTCTNPAPACDGPPCEGSASRVQECVEKDCCPVAGGWSAWSPWGPCSRTCETGQQDSTRTCTNPAPACDGRSCEGSASRVQECVEKDCCPVDGSWGHWGAWSACPVSCGGDYQQRSRQCENRACAGLACVGLSVEEQECGTDACCSEFGVWQTWSGWSSCSSTCTGGKQIRSRSCLQVTCSGGPCVGSSQDSEDCNEDICCPVDCTWNSWGDWTTCSATCGTGSQDRTRTQNPENSCGDPCQGQDTEGQECQESPIVDGVWGSWGPWSSCEDYCGNRLRTRSCDDPLPSCGGLECNGSSEETGSCDEDCCTSSSQSCCSFESSMDLTETSFSVTIYPPVEDKDPWDVTSSSGTELTLQGREHLVIEPLKPPFRPALIRFEVKDSRNMDVAFMDGGKATLSTCFFEPSGVSRESWTTQACYFNGSVNLDIYKVKLKFRATVGDSNIVHVKNLDMMGCVKTHP